MCKYTLHFGQILAIAVKRFSIFQYDSPSLDCVQIQLKKWSHFKILQKKEWLNKGGAQEGTVSFLASVQISKEHQLVVA